MIFITSENRIVNVSKSAFPRETQFYDAIHIALFQIPLRIPNFTESLSRTLDNV